MEQSDQAIQHGIPWPEAYRGLLPLIHAQWGIDGEIYLSRSLAGKSGAFVFAADLTGRDFSGQAILKLDREPDPAWQESTEAELHRKAFEAAPDYAAAHLPRLLHTLHQGDQLAILSGIAGRALEYATPWSDCPYPQQLAATEQVSRGLLEDWNRAYRLSKGMHSPQDLLRAWLAYRLDPAEGNIHSFLEQDCGIPPTTPSLIFEGQWYPNPLAFATGAAAMPKALQLRAVRGNLHGDLHGFNVLLQEQPGAAPNYFLIDLARYAPDQFLFYDHAYFEASLLLNARDGIASGEWDTILSHLMQNRAEEEQARLRADDLGLVELVGVCRKGVMDWIEAHESNRLSNMESQYYLARVAAGLNFVNKGVPTSMRRMALIYAACNLKSFLKFNALTWPKHGPELTFRDGAAPAAATLEGAASAAAAATPESAPAQTSVPPQEAAAREPAPVPVQQHTPGALAWTAGATAAIFALALGAGLLIWQPWVAQEASDSVVPDSLPKPTKPSIVVLPFEVLSAGSEAEMLAHGMTAAVTAVLAQVPDLFVTSRGSAAEFHGGADDLSDIVKALGVRYVLQGSLQMTGEKVRVLAELIDSESGEHLWAERYDRNADDTFALQDEIALKVLTSLRVKLTEGYHWTARGESTDNVEAYVLFLRAQEAYRAYTADGMEEARRLIERVRKLDPKFRAALVLGAWSYLGDATLGIAGPAKEAMEKAADLLQQAAEMDGAITSAERAQIKIAQAWIALLEGRYDEALETAKQAGDLGTNDATVLSYYGYILSFCRRYDDSIARLKQALRLNPSDVGFYAPFLARDYAFKGEPDEAIEWAKRGVARAESPIMRYISLINLVFAYQDAGRDAEAKKAVAELLKAVPYANIASIKQRQFFRYDEDEERYLDALRKAGLT